VAWLLEKMHQSIILGQNCLKQLQDRPLNWKTAVADVLVTFMTGLHWEIFDNGKWIR
jgi:hypothetical protein